MIWNTHQIYFLIQGPSFMEMVATDRLILRPWRATDSEPFAAINADPRVMEFMPQLLSRNESDQLIDRIKSHFDQYGYGLCAVERKENHTFLGYIGLWVPTLQAHFTPCVEIGWRLAAHAWGHGFATEGARAMAAYAFNFLELESIVSFTAEQNVRSRHVMEKLGMTFDPAERFDHPNLSTDHPLRRHILYRLRAQDFCQPVK